MTDRSDEIPVASRLEAQHAKAGLLVVEGHAFDEPGQDLMALFACGDKCRWRFPHAPILTALVHLAPAQRLTIACDTSLTILGHIRTACHISRPYHRTRPMMFTSPAAHS